MDSAKVYESQVKTDKAIEYYAKAKMELKKDSVMTSGYANICNSLGNLYRATGKYVESLSEHTEAREVREKVFGKKSIEYARSSANIATTYTALDQFEKAEQFAIEAKDVMEMIPDYNENAVYASIINNLGGLYFEMGKYDKSINVFLETKKIREKIFGKEHPAYAAICYNLSTLYQQIGQFEKAEPLALEAKQIRETVNGKEHPDYASNCSDLGTLYADMGLYEKAESLLLEAKQIMGKVYGKDHSVYASGCEELAYLYYHYRQPEKAESLYMESKQINEKIYGKEHSKYALSCFNLATLYNSIYNFEKAEPLYSEAKQIREKTYGKEHPFYASSCHGLADLYSSIGKYDEAESLFLTAKQIIERVYGRESKDYIRSCTGLAKLYWRLSEYEKAHDFYLEAFNIQYYLINKMFEFTSEAEKTAYLNTAAVVEKYFLSLLTTVYMPAHLGSAYDVSVSNRNMISYSVRQLRDVIFNTSDTSIKNKYRMWGDLKEQISFWYTKPIASRPLYVKDLEEEANILEKELTRLSSVFKNEHSNNKITWNEIQQKLKSNEAAIEFAEFPYFDGKRGTDSTYYIALVLKKKQERPELVKLFEKRQLESVLNSGESIATGERIDAVYTGNTSLYDLSWQPIEKHLAGISRIYFAPAGSLYKISFAALPVNDTQVLGDKYQLIQLNTTAAIGEKEQSLINSLDKIRLYGGIRYDANVDTLRRVVSQSRNITKAHSLTGNLSRGTSFQYLPGSQYEIEKIKKQANRAHLSVSVLSGINATEESFKSLNGKEFASVLHIATHGFFFPDPNDDKKNNFLQKFETSGKVFRQSANSLLRSGLLFAGGNHAWQGKPIEGIEDGILTAYEISNMYLPNTKLVVLSACETALGDIEGSEGVYGLQRAFKMVGVQNLVMSLWKVPDRETAEFMQLFYKNLFGKQTISDAFYNTQEKMKNKYRTEPYKWAAWVLVR